MLINDKIIEQDRVYITKKKYVWCEYELIVPANTTFKFTYQIPGIDPRIHIAGAFVGMYLGRSWEWFPTRSDSPEFKDFITKCEFVLDLVYAREELLDLEYKKKQIISNYGLKDD